MVGLRITGDHGKGAPASQAAPSIFDARYVRWLSQLKDRMHKLAMNGLRRPSGEGLPAADGDTADPPQNGQDTAAALQRCLLCLCILHFIPLPSLPVTSSVKASLNNIKAPALLILIHIVTTCAIAGKLMRSKCSWKEHTKKGSSALDRSQVLHMSRNCRRQRLMRSKQQLLLHNT